MNERKDKWMINEENAKGISLRFEHRKEYFSLRYKDHQDHL